MEIFNIHLFEFLLIAALALIVFGPERLPEVGRFVGKQVARFLAWQQQSPELKMLNDVRAEFEQEIASLRDELVRTRKQLDLSQEVNLNQIRDELRPMLNLREQVKGAVAEAAKPAQTAADPPAAPGSAPAEPAVGEALADAAADAARPAGQPEAGHPPEPSADPAEAPAPAPDIAAPEQAAPPSPAVEPAEPAEQLLDAAPRPAPEGTVQAAARPNRLAAAEPTGALGPPDEHPALRETRRRGPLDQAAYADPPAAPGDAPAATNGQAAYDDLPAPLATNGQAPPAPAAPPISTEELRLLMLRLETLGADLHALISGLQAQGVIGADWAPDAALTEQESLSR